MSKYGNKKKNEPVPHKVLSDRGVHLETAHRASENNNLLHGQTAFMWKNPNGEEVPIKVGQICPKCRKRVRGLHHAEGYHHNHSS